MVEHLLAKERVESSNLFIRFHGPNNQSIFFDDALHQHSGGEARRSLDLAAKNWNNLIYVI